MCYVINEACVNVSVSVELLDAFEGDHAILCRCALVRNRAAFREIETERWWVRERQRQRQRQRQRAAESTEAESQRTLMMHHLP